MDGVPPRAAWNVRNPTVWPGPPRVEGLLEEGTDALPVRVVIEQDGWVTGWDDGALGFEEDALFFSGRACSFRVVSRDLSRRKPKGIGLVETRRAVVLRHPTREVVLSFTIVVSPDRRDWEDEERLVRGLARLDVRSNASGRGQYPPLCLRPGASPILAAEWANAKFGGACWGWPLSYSRGFRPPSYARDRRSLLSALAEEDRE